MFPYKQLCLFNGKLPNYESHFTLLLITNSHRRHQMSMFFPGIRSLEDWTHCAKLPAFHQTASVTPLSQQLPVKPQSALEFFLCFYSVFIYYYLLLPMFVVLIICVHHWTPIQPRGPFGSSFYPCTPAEVDRRGHLRSLCVWVLTVFCSVAQWQHKKPILMMDVKRA